jgi:hypothetical protein
MVGSNAVSAFYSGSIPLDVSPSLPGGIKSIANGDTVQIPASIKYEFMYDSMVVASVWNRIDMWEVVITGGNFVKSAGPLTFKVALSNP